MIPLLLAVVLTTAQAAPGPALENDAWHAIRDRRADDAERLFEQLTSRQPEDARAWLGYAAAALLRGRDVDARPRLERALTLEPANAEAALLLADVFYRQGRAIDSIRVLERAAAAGAQDAAVSSRLARLRAEQDLHAGFNQANSARFTVLMEGPPEHSLAAAVVQDLDAAWDHISTTLFTQPQGTITVTLYTESQFTDITRAPAWAAAAYDGRIRVPVRGALADRAELKRVLTHELAHAFVRAAAPRNVPTWLDEGIASVVEPRSLEWARAQALEAGRLLAPSSLRGSFRTLDGDDARLAYAQSALLVQAMIDLHSAGAVNALLGDLGRGVAFDAAFRSRMYEPFELFFDRFASALGLPYDGAGRG